MKVLKIGAQWCPECVIMKSRWEKIEKKYPQLKTEYFDCDQQPEISRKYQIEKVPTFIFLDRRSQEIARLSGLVSDKELEKIIKDNIES